ncbi:SSI family serine proteinase inhibitor [Actinomadura macrotermitis]|uniref:Subtilase-type protease inhibitor n=1 Tax=Actinomadura macrotermitis TaxID=2585200 RepID=A0A7K0BU32_9ACTN|nr:SSI family serine proteinase inhibitor [Actinomadura macrotermitis]MQY04204.1 subtilase-type protease inhibitor [Actinomadura macrotermitis]
MPHLFATALAGAALALPPAVPALADTPRAELRLTLTYPSADRSPHISGTRTVVLRCGPDGGTHPEAARACAWLLRTGGRFEAGDHEAFCTLEYAPVVAEATGHWHGKPVRFHRRYGNTCALRSRTGPVFAF